MRKRHFILSLVLVAVILSCADEDRSLAWESYADLFADPVNYAVGSDPGKVCVGDFDGDSYFDLAVLSPISNRASILMNDGNAGFHNPELRRTQALVQRYLWHLVRRGNAPDGNTGNHQGPVDALHGISLDTKSCLLCVLKMLLSPYCQARAY